MPDEKRALKVFLCHAHSDRDAVKALYARLKREGVDVWLDKEKLLPGADWEYEIRKAVREADVVVVCLSKQFNQAGFRQKEVRIALDAAMEKPEGEIFIIPARLEECDSLESLNRWHWVDLFERDGFQRLILALRVRANKIGAALQQRGRATASRPEVNAELEAAKARLEAEEAERIRLTKEQADREAADAARLAREKAEKEAAEKLRLEAEEAEKRRLAKVQADREAAVRLAREKAEKDALEKAAREKTRLEAEEVERRRLVREKVERRKMPRKPNATIITGGFGLVGIIFVAIIASLWGDLFPRAPEPTATLSSTPTEMEMLTPIPEPTFTLTYTVTLTSTSTPSAPFNYTIQEGDSLFSIAEKYSLGDDGIELILFLNPFAGINENTGYPIGIDPQTQNVLPGQIILLPNPGMELPTSTPVPPDLAKGTKIEYIIQKGDSLASIAALFNSTIEDIILENKITDPNGIVVGQLLVIPVNLVTPTPPSISGVIAASEGGGANLRQTPNGKYLMTLDSGSTVEVLPDSRQVNGVTWIHVFVIRDGQRREGWLLKSVVNYSTPTAP